MRIGVIGKFPPIQGGVSTRTYLAAHALAAAGHDVHVITNAKEVTSPFRMLMRTEDWGRCEGSYGAGAVTVHWSDPVDRSQSYVPMASAFVSKLATIAAEAHAQQPFDVIYSHYMEPYGVAGHLASQMTGVPHVVRMAGSDAGRLWHHPQFEALYDHVLRSADIMVAAGAVAERAVRRGVKRDRIAPGGAMLLPSEFTPQGTTLDIAALRTEVARSELRETLWGDFAADRPHFGVYGKLGETKGSFALLAALHRLKRDGFDVGLVALAHGRFETELCFRNRVRELGLVDRVLQIPFLPHWRVPEFLRGCLAVCCLEQNFPISIHSPIVPLEVLLCGSCLIASAELIRKLPEWDRLPHGYGCVAIENVNDIEELSGKLAAVAREPEAARMIGRRGHAFATECQQGADFPRGLENLLESAAQRRLPARARPAAAETADNDAGTDAFPLARMAAAALDRRDLASSPPTCSTDRGRNAPFDPAGILARLETAIGDGNENLACLAQAVRVEVAIARAEAEGGRCPADDPLFRLACRSLVFDEETLARSFPVREPSARILRFNYDIGPFRGIRSMGELPREVASNPSYLIVFARGARRDPLLVDGLTARILELSDGTRTSRQIVAQLRREFGIASSSDRLAWVERLFVIGLLGLRDTELQRQSNAV